MKKTQNLKALLINIIVSSLPIFNIIAGLIFFCFLYYLSIKYELFEQMNKSQLQELLNKSFITLTISQITAIVTGTIAYILLKKRLNLKFFVLMNKIQREIYVAFVLLGPILITNVTKVKNFGSLIFSLLFLIFVRILIFFTIRFFTGTSLKPKNWIPDKSLEVTLGNLLMSVSRKLTNRLALP